MYSGLGENTTLGAKNHIILSGFSLGTEPMMVLGSLNPDIFAFVYNDFLCRTLERAKTMTMPNGRGVRSAPNSIRHLIPGFWKQFDFPDIVAALAPRPVICTEGGLDRDFQLISAAYRMAGAPDHFQYHHQPRFADPAQRWHGSQLPAGLDRDAFSVSPMWTRATISSKKTWSFPGLKPSWIKAIIKTSPAPDKNRPEPPEQDIPSSLGMRIYPAAHLPERMPQLSAKARHRPGAPFHVHELK